MLGREIVFVGDVCPGRNWAYIVLKSSMTGCRTAESSVPDNKYTFDRDRFLIGSI